MGRRTYLVGRRMERMPGASVRDVLGLRNLFVDGWIKSSAHHPNRDIICGVDKSTL